MHEDCCRDLCFIRSTLLAGIAVLASFIPAHATSPDDAWSRQEAQVVERDFFVLKGMEDNLEVNKALAADSTLESLQQEHDQKLHDALASCHDATCFDDALRWTDGEIAAVAESLQRLTAQNSAMRRFVEEDLRGSGRFPLYKQQSPPALIASAWRDAAAALNRIVAVYGEGKPPLYARIDSMRYDPKSPEFVESLQASTAVILAEEESSPRLFFFATLKYAVLLLASNDRLDAGRFEPLEATENQAAVRRVRAINWKQFPYSVIVVPGEGPDQPDVKLSPLGRIRVELAVRLYREGKAPFILVSGGSVHPAQTKFDEAIEMRKELEAQWGIPDDAVLVDPYARHTTTNLRNASREVIRYGIPRNKPMLISSDAAQVRMIVSAAFQARCMREMHLLPWTSLKQASSSEAVMFPNDDSLQENADEPLDP